MLAVDLENALALLERKTGRVKKRWRPAIPMAPGSRNAKRRSFRPKPWQDAKVDGRTRCLPPAPQNPPSRLTAEDLDLVIEGTWAGQGKEAPPTCMGDEHPHWRLASPHQAPPTSTTLQAAFCPGPNPPIRSVSAKSFQVIEAWSSIWPPRLTPSGAGNPPSALGACTSKPGCSKRA